VGADKTVSERTKKLRQQWITEIDTDILLFSIDLSKREMQIPVRMARYLMTRDGHVI